MVGASVLDAPKIERLDGAAAVADASSTQAPCSDLAALGIEFLDESESPEPFADEEDDSDDCSVHTTETHFVLAGSAATHGCERDDASTMWVAGAPRGPPCA